MGLSGLRRVVVTGLGTVNPCGNDVESSWEAIVSARSGTGLLTHFDATGLPSQVAAEVEGFDAVEYFGKRHVRRLGKFMQFGLAAGDEAIRDAGFDVEALMDAAQDDTPIGPYDKPRAGSTWDGIGGFVEIAEQASEIEGRGRSSGSVGSSSRRR